MDDVLWGFYYLTQLLHSSMQQDEATWKGSVYKWMDLENWTTSNLYAEIFYAPPLFPAGSFEQDYGVLSRICLSYYI